MCSAYHTDHSATFTNMSVWKNEMTYSVQNVMMSKNWKLQALLYRALSDSTRRWICVVLCVVLVKLFCGSSFYSILMTRVLISKTSVEPGSHRYRAQRSAIYSRKHNLAVPCVSHLSKADRCASVDAIRAVPVEAELQEALTNKSILMIGDSRSNQLLRYVMGLLNPEHRTDKIFHHCDKRMEVTDPKRNITIVKVLSFELFISIVIVHHLMRLILDHCRIFSLYRSLTKKCSTPFTNGL